MYKKRLIFVTAPPGCGKTTLSQRLAKELEHVVYLDKDTLIPLSKKIFDVSGQPYDRSSEFFQKVIRDTEYDVIMDLAFEALQYEDFVMVNAPFTSEIRDRRYLNDLRDKLKKYDAALSVIWILTRPDVCRRRMFERNSDRDIWKINHWNEYVKTVDFSIPSQARFDDDDMSLIIYQNNTYEETEQSFGILMRKFRSISNNF